MSKTNKTEEKKDEGQGKFSIPEQEKEAFVQALKPIANEFCKKIDQLISATASKLVGDKKDPLLLLEAAKALTRLGYAFVGGRFRR